MFNFQTLSALIWNVADDVLRGLFKPHEYGDVILPFVILRRLDCVIEPRKDDSKLILPIILIFFIDCGWGSVTNPTQPNLVTRYCIVQRLGAGKGYFPTLARFSVFSFDNEIISPGLAFFLLKFFAAKTIWRAYCTPNIKVNTKNINHLYVLGLEKFRLSEYYFPIIGIDNQYITTIIHWSYNNIFCIIVFYYSGVL